MINTLAQLSRQYTREMTMEEVDLFLYAAMQEPPTIAPIEALFQDDLEKPKALQAICNRIVAVAPGLECCAELVLYVAMLCRTFGDCTLWTHTIVIESLKQRRALTMLDFSKLFPLGVPSDEGMRIAWDAQKHEKGFNLLDWGSSYKLEQVAKEQEDALHL